ncbi:MAG: hypothetical protein FWD64_06845 [Acidobacteriaceae bacterium]|nr:hypothetical protein [Acidobacteriaceae bacterium]
MNLFSFFRKGIQRLHSKRQHVQPDDEYVIKVVPILHEQIYLAAGETDIFTGNLQHAERFHDPQSALDRARELNSTLSSTMDCHFSVALCE